MQKQRMQESALGLDQIGLKFPEKALQVVRFISQTNKFELTNEAKEFLQSLKGEIGFVVVCGRYRTGKSFLLNKLLDATNDGFRVDAATDSCTQGIWMYTKPLYNAVSGVSIYFLDSEGSESVERSSTHDAKIFALAILMSSVFVFNSVGCIDETSISQLQLTTTLAKNIQVQESHSAGESSGANTEGLLEYYTPKFIWVLRDFVLEPKDKTGKKLTSKEYLENALTEDSHSIKVSENNKKIRKSLLQFFKDRDCFAMIRPVFDEAQLKTMAKMPVTQLREEFQQQLIVLREQIIKGATPKSLNGVNLNGRMFTQMLDNYINVINRGGIPNISTAWDHIIENECIYAFDQAKQLYESAIRQHFANDEPKNFDEIFQCLKKSRDDAYQVFHSIAGIREKNNYFEQFRHKLQDFMNDKESMALKLNDDMNSARNENLIQQLSEDLKKNVSNGIYTADDIDFFLTDFNKLLLSYDREAQGTQKANTLIYFLQNTHPTIIKQLVQSIKGKYDKSSNVDYERGIFQEKEKNFLDNIKILEDNIEIQEKKVRKLDQEKIILEQQRNSIQQQLEKIKNENQALNDKSKDIEQLTNQIRGKEEEIQNLKKHLAVRDYIIQSLQVKKKKGCCG